MDWYIIQFFLTYTIFFLIQNEFGYAGDEIAYFQKVIQPVLDGISLKIM